MNISLKSQFPALNQLLDGYPLCYLDTAATSQKPQSVIDAMNGFYQYNNANVHRAAHQLSARATRDFEAVREKVAGFINASQSAEIIFTSGTTHSINLLAWGLTLQLAANEVILIDSAAHHANIVPWQELAKRTGARIKPIPLRSNFTLDEQAFVELLQAHKVKIVALCHVSNVLGTVNDVTALASQAHRYGALVAVDGAQAVAHHPVDVQALGCDFYSFSGHKMYSPAGVGILWGRFNLLDSLIPLMTGGEMIDSVSFTGTTFGQLPNRLEAGTPAIADVIGLGAAIDFMMSLPAEAFAHEQQMLMLLRSRLEALPGVVIYGSPHHQSGAVAFNLSGEHHQDIGILLDQQGIAVRCGHHCAQPLMQLMQVSGCCRASVGVYTTPEDIDRFIHAMQVAIELLA
ncbi:MAG: cysteine desulfurase [Shewanella sp.]|nr:cysteine desulfurase [Shewanella sp.]MCF1430670.1 cysteine desulfurase [Shewanella sp.]MCF1439275.1 cysteine desulfurase [Shewanella sp.]MCF1457272.1 cysteine desulfurase [Shewanella sp.]